MFYSTRMFRAACQKNRVDILRFMLVHGFSLEQIAMRDILHCVIEEIVDEQHADAAQPVIRFLLEVGVDVNWQVLGWRYLVVFVAQQQLTCACVLACY